MTVSAVVSDTDTVVTVISDLLDDVLSELDHNRQNYLLQAIDDTQTIITCTGLDDFVKNRFTLNKVYEVENGCVHLHSNMMEDKNESE